MNEKKRIIDYSKFKCEIYNPDGKYLKDAKFNKDNNFYCSGLIPGQKYFVVFSYDGIFLQCFSFTCDIEGKVVYLSPAHIVFNHSVEVLSGNFLNSIKSMIKNRLNYNVPQTRWAKRALDAFIDSTHEGKKKSYCANQPLAFEIGKDLMNNVK